MIPVTNRTGLESCDIGLAEILPDGRICIRLTADFVLDGVLLQSGDYLWLGPYCGHDEPTSG